MPDMWTRMKDLEGLTDLVTLGQGRKFDVRTVDDEGVKLFVKSTGNERRIPRSEFEAAYSLKQPGVTLERAEIEASGASPRNSSYVEVLLDVIDDEV